MVSLHLNIINFAPFLAIPFTFAAFFSPFLLVGVCVRRRESIGVGVDANVFVRVLFLLYFFCF